MSDGIKIIQQFKIMTDLFSISHFYLSRAAGVKLKLDHLGPPQPVMYAAKLMFSEN